MCWYGSEGIESDYRRIVILLFSQSEEECEMGINLQGGRLLTSVSIVENAWLLIHCCHSVHMSVQLVMCS